MKDPTRDPLLNCLVFFAMACGFAITICLVVVAIKGTMLLLSW